MGLEGWCSPRTQLNDALIESYGHWERKTATRCGAHNFMSESRKARRPGRMALFKLDLPLSVLSWVKYGVIVTESNFSRRWEKEGAKHSLSPLHLTANPPQSSSKEVAI